MPRRIALHQRHGAVQHFRDVDDCRLQLERPCEFQKTRHQRIGTIHFAGNEPRHLARQLVVRRHVFGQHFRRGSHSPERIAKLVRQSGRQLPQRRQPLGPSHRRFRFAQMPVGFRELLRHFLVFGRLHAQFLSQRVHQISGNCQKDPTQNQHGNLVRIDRVPAEVDKQQKRNIRAVGQQREQQRGHHPEICGRRNHGEKQDEVVRAVDGSREADQQVAEEQLQNNPKDLAAPRAQERNPRFGNVQSRERQE